MKQIGTVYHISNLANKKFSGSSSGLRAAAGAFLLIFVFAATVQAQHPITGYTFSASSSTFTQISGTFPFISGGNFDDGYYNSIPIGFTFYYLDTSYTSLAAATNGYLALGRSLTLGENFNNLTGGVNRPYIAPLWDDLVLKAGSGYFSYITTGIAPNRIFTAQWLNVQWPYGQPADTNAISFQVKLYEGSNKIEFVYRQENDPTFNSLGTASIGISASGSGLLSLDGTGSNPNANTYETTALNIRPATGQIYRFTPGPAVFTEIEANNDTTHANLIYYYSSAGDTASGSIYSGDIDYYRFTATSGDTIAIHAFNPAGSYLDGRIQLYSRIGSLLGDDDDYGSTTESRVVYPITTSGTYWIRYTYYAQGGSFPTEAPKNQAFSASQVQDPTGPYLLEIHKGSLKPDILDRYIQLYSLTTNSATIQSVVASSNLVLTSHTLQYGLTTAYGNSVSLSNFNSGQSAGYDYPVLTGLIPNTTYHYRIVATNSAGTTVGQDHILTTPPAPVITSLSTNSGAVGSTVVINGANFDGYYGDNKVYFGAVRATVTSGTSNSLTVTVPSGATYAPVTVTTFSGATAYSKYPFDVTFTSGRIIDASTFSSRTNHSSTATPRAEVLADLDGDGKLDVITANSANISVFRNIGSLGSPAFTAGIDSTVGGTVRFAAVGDLDGDGKLDIVVNSRANSTVTIFQNSSTIGSIAFSSKVVLAGGVGTNGVAVADVDGDGKPDIVATNFTANTISVFRNQSVSGLLSSSSFASHLDFASGSGPYGVSVADFDGDGKPDVVTTNLNTDSVSVFRNTSTPGVIGFASRIDINVGTAPWQGAIADIDGDGKLDIVVANDGSASISVLRNTSPSQGTIAFASKADFAASAPTILSVGDLDGDGRPDIVVSDTLTIVYRNLSTTGNISLAQGVSYSTDPGIGVAIGDVDGDAKADIVATGNLSFSVLRNTVGPPPIVPTNLTVVDSTQDSQLGLKWRKNTDAGIARYRVYRSTSPGANTKIDSTSGVTDTSKVVFGANYTRYYFRVTAVNTSGVESDFSNEVNAQTKDVTAPTIPQSLAAVDSGSGYVALKWRKNSEGDFARYRVFGGSSQNPTTQIDSTAKGNASDTSRTIFGLTNGIRYYFRVAAVDTNSNQSSYSNQAAGTPTVISTPPTLGSISPLSGPVGTVVTITGSNFSSTPNGNVVYFGPTRAPVLTATTGQLTVMVPRGAIYAPITVTTNGLTGYSTKPFLVTYRSGNVIDVSSLAPRVDFTAGTSPNGVVIADLDGDGKSDIVVANQGSNTISVYRNTGLSPGITAGSFAPKVDFSTGGTLPYGIAVGDVDGDGKLDLVVSNYTGASVSVFRNTSTTGTISSSSFAAAVTFTSGANPADLSIIDIDGDGKPEIVVSCLSSNAVSVFRNTSSVGSINSGSFAAKVEFATSAQPYGLGTGDIDGDGKPDVVVTTFSTDSVSVLRNTSSIGSITSGSFAGRVSFGTGSKPRSVAIVDLDGDGKSDLVVTNNGAGSGNTMSAFRNTSTVGNVGFAARVDFTTGTGPHGVGVGDIDGDGKPDIAVNANPVSLFRNTSTVGNISIAAKVDYNASGANGIAIGDLEGDGKPDVVYATEVAGTFSILRNTVYVPSFLEVESNNTASTANTIAVGDSMDGSVNPLNDVDYYKFQAFAGDTLEFFAQPRGTSQLFSYLQVYDSLGNGYAFNNYSPSNDKPHIIVRVNSNGKYYVRESYAYNYTYYPNSPPPNNPMLQPLSRPSLQAAATGSTSVATSDTGQYRLRVKVFTPSAPEAANPYAPSIFSTSAVFTGNVGPNGLSTNVSFEYGLSTSYGNTVQATGNPFSGIYNIYVSAKVSGLAPNTQYHFRMVATNSKGTSYSQDFVFTTPVPSVNWSKRQDSGEDLYSVSFANSTVGTAVGSQSILRTTTAAMDGASQPHPGVGWLFGVSFFDVNNGIAVGGYPSVLRTSDGGATWSYPTTLTGSGYFRSVRYADANTVVAVGYPGMIQRSTDGGLNWSAVSSGTSNELLSIYFVNSTTGYAVGASGTILKTTDAGATWGSQTSNTTSTLFGVCFTDVNNGFAVGDNGLLGTTNAGLNWTPTGSFNGLQGVSFSDANNGLMVGYQGKIYRTTDGGSTWKQEESGTTSWLSAVSYVGPQALVVGGSGTILHTGLMIEAEPNNNANQPNKIAYGDSVDARIDSSGILYPTGGDVDYYSFDAQAGDTVEIYAYNLGGSQADGTLELYDGSGTFLASNDDFHFVDLFQNDSKLAYVVQNSGQHYIRYSWITNIGTFPNSPAPNTELPTKNSGGGIVNVPMGIARTAVVPAGYRLRLRRVGPSAPDLATQSTQALFSDAALVTGNVIAYATNPSIQVQYGTTTSYGLTAPLRPQWQPTGFNTQFVASLLTGLQPSTTYHYRLAGSNSAGSSFSENRSFTTPAAPDRWVRQVVPLDETLRSVSFANYDTGTVVGSFGVIMHTVNGGKTWASQNSGVSAELFGVDFQTGTVGTAVGNLSVLLRTTDGGTTWSSQSSPVSAGYRAVSFVNTSTGTAVGTGGVVIRTTDGGTNWATQTSNTGNNLRAVDFLDANTGIASGFGGTIVTTTDGGITWVPRTSGTTALLTGVSLASVSVAVAVGDTGTIVRTANGGTNWAKVSSGTTLALRGVSFADANNGYIVGDNGTVLRTTDAGATWSPQASGTNAFLLGVQSLDNKLSMAVGSLGTLLRRDLRPATPQNLTLVDATVSNQITIRWRRNNDPNFLRYRIYGGTSPNPVTKIDSTTGGSIDTTKTVTGLTNGVPYYFRVTALDSSFIESSFSNQVSGVPGSRPPKAFAEGNAYNDSAGAAIGVIYGDTVTASVNPIGDIDYYKFSAAAGDTVEIYADTTSNSALLGYYAVFDSMGNTYAYGYYPSYQYSHVIFPVYSSRTYYIRYAFAYTYSYTFPNSIPSTINGSQRLAASPNSIRPIALSANSVAINDTGGYRLRVKPFTPSAPELWYMYAQSVFTNSATVGGYILPNGLNTTVTIEYGSTDSYGSSVVATRYNGSDIQYVSYAGSFGGLVPNSTYHYRLVATNGAGTYTSPDYSFSTPPPSDGWTIQPTGATEFLEGVSFVNENTGFVGGGYDGIYKTTNRGQTWVSQATAVDASGNYIYPYALWAIDASKVIAAGSGSSPILRTTDGGSTWAAPTVNISGNYLLGVRFVNSTTGTAVGSGGTIVRSTDAGATWTTQTSNTSQYLYGVYFSDANTGTVVGDNGTILRTTNGGTNWNAQTSNTSYSLYGVWFFDSNNGVVVGGGGTVLRTSNGGSTWTSATSGVGNWLYNVWFYNGLNGIVVGDNGTILRTTDGGATWASQNSGTYNTLIGLSVAGRATFATGQYGTVLNYLAPAIEVESNNSIPAANLTSIGDAVGGSISPVNDVDFFKFAAANVDTLDVFAGTTGNSTLRGLLQVYDKNGLLRSSANFIPSPTSQHVIFRSTATDTFYVRYTAAVLNDTGSYQIRLRRFAPSAAEVGLGGASNIFSSSATIASNVAPNGLSTNISFEYGPSLSYGNTVQSPQNPVSGVNIIGGSAPLTGLAANTTYHYRTTAQNQAGTAIGSDIVFTTPAAPEGWVRQAGGTAATLLGVSFLNTSTGTAVGAGGTILRTTDGGNTWATQTSGTTATLRGVSFSDVNTGTIVGTGGTILRTTNGGTNWATQTSGTTNYLRAVKFLSTTTGIVVGVNGTILKTTNGGTNWTPQTSGTTKILYGVFLIDANNYVAVGDSGAILRSTDGGVTWPSQNSGTTQALLGAHFTSSSTGVVTGAGGTILRTTNSGTNWSSVTSNTGEILYSVVFPATNNGTIAGSGGVVLKSTDQGSTWTSQASGTTNQLISVSFAQSDTGTVVGDLGTILRYARATSAPLAPTLASPADVATGQSLKPTLQWNPSANASAYHVLLATDNLFNNLVASGTDTAVVDTFKTVTTNLGYSTTYYWRVRAKNTFGFGSYSATRSFTTQALSAPSAPTLASPLNAATNQSLSLTLRWNSSSTATGYRVQVGTDQTFSGGIAKDSTLADTTWAIGGLSAKTTYYWHVSATNSGGTSSYSSAFSFQTQDASAPTVATNAASGVGLNSAILNATVNPNGQNTSAYFEYGQTLSYGFTTVSRALGNGTSAVAISDTVRALAANTLYHYRVVATNPQGQSAGSDQTFTTVTAPTSPQGTVLQVASYTTTTVSLSWSDWASNEESYRLDRKIGAGSYAEYKQLAANTTSYQDTGLTANTTYTYRLRAYNSAGYSTYTNEVSQSTINSPYAVLSAKPVNFANLEVPLLTLDSVIVLTNNGNATLSVQGPTLAGTDASQFSVVNVSTTGQTVLTGVYSLAPGQLINARVRFAPSTTGSKTAVLQYVTNDTLHYGSSGTVRDTLLGTGVDTTPPGAPVSLSGSPIGWNKSSTFTINWLGPSDPSGVTKLWYKYDSAPSSGSPGTSVTAQTSGAAGTASIPSPSTPGAHTTYFYLEDGNTPNGNKSVNNFTTLTLKFDNISPAITHNAASVGKVTILNGAVTSTPPSITASVSKSTSLSGVVPTSFQMQYRKSSDINWTSVTYSSLSGNAQIPNTAFLTSGTPNGVDYHIVATDSAGNSASTQIYSIVVEIQSTQPSPFTPPAAGTNASTQVQAYRLFSVPLILSDERPSSFIPGSLGDHSSNGVSWVNWRMQRVVGGAKQDYDQFADQQVMKAGAAFFLIVAETKTITVGAGKVVKADSMYNTGIPISTGWNLVGNPFNFDFSSDSLAIVGGGSITDKAYYTGTGGTFGWDLNTGNAFTLKKWEGLAVKVSGATASSKLIFKPLGPLSSVAPGEGSLAVHNIQNSISSNAQNWLIQLDAMRQDNGMKHLNVLAGMAVGASDVYDANDWSMPPFVGEKNVAVSFLNSDESWVRDIRTINDKGATWAMRLMTGDHGAKINLNIAGALNIPNPSFEAYLIDLDEKMAYDLKITNALQVNSGNGLRNFRLVVGTKDFVEQNSGGVDLVPSEFKLFANYPNPFNPETIIRYTLAGSAERYQVSLKVYNLIGQEVAAVVEADQKPGYYEAKFDGRNMSSGVYFYRIIVNTGSKQTTFSDMKKMVLLK